jgi:hypothetical protein
MSAVVKSQSNEIFGSGSSNRIEEFSKRLDPISILAFAALLRFKESGTLVGIQGYEIKAEQPSDYTWYINLQGVYRRLQGEGREDLAIFQTAIHRGALWFQPQLSDNTHYRTLFVFASAGLESLKNTYRNKGSEITVSAIEKWRETISAVTYVSDTQLENSKLDFITQKVKTLWNLAEIKEVNSLLEQMHTLQGDTSPGIDVKCKDQIARLELLLSQKAKKLKLIYKDK